MRVLEWIFLLFTFVASGGALFTDWGHKHRSLVLLASAVSLAMTLYFYRDRYIEWLVPPKTEMVRDEPRTPASPPMKADEVFWLSIKDAAAPALFEEFLKRFPASTYADSARARLDAIQRGMAAMPTPSTATPTRPYCERGEVFDRALAGPSADLRGYIRECEPTGSYVERARVALSAKLYGQALACVRTSCDFERCLSIFGGDFPSSDKFASLRNEVDRERGSRRCSITVAAGDEAMVTAVSLSQRGNSRSAAEFAEKALSIWAALPNANDAYIKDRIASAHNFVGIGLAVLGATDRDRSLGCSRLQTARKLFVETGNTDRIAKVDDDIRFAGCAVRR